MKSYENNLADWCEAFLAHLNLAVEVCGADQVPTRELPSVVCEKLVNGTEHFIGQWADAQLDAAVEHGEFMLVAAVLNGNKSDGYRVRIKRRHLVDRLLSQYQDSGARTQGRGIVQASETFTSPQEAARWVLEHNAVLLELLQTLPAEVEAFAELKALAATLEGVEVIRNVNDFQVRINSFPNAYSVKQFLLFLQAHETWVER